GPAGTGVTLTLTVPIEGESIDVQLPVHLNQGRFATWTSLEPGTFDFVALATAPSGQTAQDTLTITVQPDPPDYTSASTPDVSPTAGFAPLTVTFGGRAAAAPAVTVMDLDADGDGLPDFRLNDFRPPPHQVSYTYQTPGLYVTTLV